MAEIRRKVECDACLAPPRVAAGSAAPDHAFGEVGPVGTRIMRYVKWLAVLPFLGILVGAVFLNRVTPFVLGMPLLLAWIVLWILLTAAIMAVIYYCDPANRGAEGGR
jgi:hypothetical protein